MRDIDSDRYAELLSRARPGLIETPEEHDRLLGIAEELMDKGESISPEEEKLLALLVFLIEAFEAEVRQGDVEDEDEGDEPFQPAPAHETIRRLLQARQLELNDIADIFGNPQAAREALEGRRPVTSGQAKQLSKFFRVPAKLFRE